jgi:hypothetical protein
MLKSRVFLYLAFLFLVCPLATAEIIDWTCDDDGDGAIVMESALFGPSAEGYSLELICTQNWYPGHLQGDFITDTPEDPTVSLVQIITNDTDFVWTDYHITIGMPQPFSIVGAFGPTDWTWNVTPATDRLALPGHPTPRTCWVGTIHYYAGSPIPIGGSGRFGFVVSFEGTVSFCTEQIPTPEPTSVLLLALGALTVLRRR